jgi:hypothetical protein
MPVTHVITNNIIPPDAVASRAIRKLRSVFIPNAMLHGFAERRKPEARIRVARYSTDA